MEWVLLSILGGFGQALAWGLKKKALDGKKGVNNITGLISYVVAGMALLCIYFALEAGNSEVHLTIKFWTATFFVIILNILATWTGYRAIDQSALSALMPFLSLTALAIVPIEYLLRHTLPSTYQLWGIVIVVLGALIISIKKDTITKNSLAMAGYFSVTLVCYSIASPLMGVAVTESGSGILSATIAHLGIGLGFIPIVLMSRESKTVSRLRQEGKWSRLFFWMVLAGIVIAVLENGPINVALESTTASEVFALKRTMPFFALLLGVLMFQERVTLRHGIGTTFLVIGSTMIVWFR